MAQDPAVIVVGAGPTGLTMGIELARYGVPFRIVDADPGVHPHSRAVGIQARTMEYFERAGMVERFLQAGIPWHGISIYSAGRRIMHVPFTGIETRYSYIFSVPQDETETMLQGRLAELGVQVERNTRVTAIAPEPDTVRLTIVKPDGTTEEAVAPYVVGCDGAHSIVRDVCGSTLSGVTVNQRAFALADVVVDGVADDEITIFTREGAIAAFFPLPKGRIRIITASPEHRDDSADPTLAELQSVVDGVAPRPVELSDPVWMTRFRINQRKAPHYAFGRMFLAGDAAHIHSPIGAQGMNTGIQDAVNLAWKLALVTGGRTAASLLASYDTERSPIGNQLILATDVAGLLAIAPRPLRFVRDRIAPILTSFPQVQEMMRSIVSELAINYRHSPIVEDRRTGIAGHWQHGVRAGDRAPDADLQLPGGGATTLFAHLHAARHVVVVFANADEPAPDLAPWNAALAAYPAFANLVTIAPLAGAAAPGDATAALLDPPGHAYEAYGVRGSAAFVIRPDGYVGAVAEPADPKIVHGYLQCLGAAVHA